MYGYSGIDPFLPLTGLFTFLGVGLLIAIICSLFPKRKSKEYRELMADMYIVGMIKKFAAEDKVDLIAELKDFARIERKSRIRREMLDTTVEAELQAKIAKISEEHIEKAEKK